jgi:16S rRNA (guanine966-N2)-methyltransferase
MRVIAGSVRGRRLAAPKGSATRPTSDRVREAVFNTLASLDAVRDAAVWDLWCGSGALGIEALSRGATSATFVDRDPAAIDAVRRNVAACGFERAARIQRAEVERWLDGQASGATLVLADPPYEFDGWAELFARLDAEWVVAESDREIEPPEPYEVVRSRRYGRTWVTIARRAAVLPGGAPRELP